MDCQEGAHEHHPSADGTLREGGGEMKKIEIISDDHRHHVYVGNIDFWLDTMELVELYKKLGHVEP